MTMSMTPAFGMVTLPGYGGKFCRTMTGSTTLGVSFVYTSTTRAAEAGAGPGPAPGPEPGNGGGTIGPDATAGGAAGGAGGGVSALIVRSLNPVASTRRS